MTPNQDEASRLKLLVVGAGCALGQHLSRQARSSGWQVFETTRATLDLAHHDVWPGEVPQVDWVAWLAGNSRVSRCESEPEATAIINVEHPKALILPLIERGARVLFPSTSLVFQHYPAPDESTPTNPGGSYAHQKLAMEQFLLGLPGCLVTRLTKIVHREEPLIRHWREAAQRGVPAQAFNNQYISPVRLSWVVCRMLDLTSSGESGLVHLSGPRAISYLEWARLLKIPVVPTTAASIGAPTILASRRSQPDLPPELIAAELSE